MGLTSIWEVGSILPEYSIITHAWEVPIHLKYSILIGFSKMTIFCGIPYLIIYVTSKFKFLYMLCMLHSQDSKDYCWKMKTWLELKRIGIIITNDSFFSFSFWLSTIKIEGLRLGAIPPFPLIKYIYTFLTFNSFIFYKNFI